MNRSMLNALPICLALLAAARTAHAEPTPPPLPAGEASTSVDAKSTVTGPTTTTSSSATDADRAEAAGRPRYDLVRINVGPRFDYVSSSAFDPYATSDVLTQFSIDGTYPLLVRNRLVLAAGLGWSVGGRSATTRGAETSLTAHRFLVPLEGRYHLGSWGYAFGKLAPGVAMMNATVTEGSSPNDLTARGWAFAADVSVGASILLGPRQHPEKRGIRIYLTPEVGYAFTTKASFDARPDRDPSEALGTDESTSVRALALSGVFWRASVGLTF